MAVSTADAAWMADEADGSAEGSGEGSCVADSCGVVAQAEVAGEGSPAAGYGVAVRAAVSPCPAEGMVEEEGGMGSSDATWPTAAGATWPTAAGGGGGVSRGAADVGGAGISQVVSPLSCA